MRGSGLPSHNHHDHAGRSAGTWSPNATTLPAPTTVGSRCVCISVCVHPGQDYVDLVEYLLGNSSTTWGAQRVADGHPAPYTNVLAFEIGNEQCVGLRASLWCPLQLHTLACHHPCAPPLFAPAPCLCLCTRCLPSAACPNCVLVLVTGGLTGTTLTGWSRYGCTGTACCLLLGAWCVVLWCCCALFGSSQARGRHVCMALADRLCAMLFLPMNRWLQWKPTRLPSATRSSMCTCFPPTMVPTLRTPPRQR